MSPDVVIVVIDALRADALGPYGATLGASPTFDKFAEGAGLWEQAHAQSSWTLPSVASLLTGRYVHEHGAGRYSGGPGAGGRGAWLREIAPLPDSEITLAEALRDAGYATAAFMNNPMLSPSFGLSQGFALYDSQPADNAHNRTATSTSEAALQWLEAAPAPRFALVHFMEPHADYAAPQPLLGSIAGPKPVTFGIGLESGVFSAMQRGAYVPDEVGQRWVRARYAEEVRAADDGLAVLLDGLDALGTAPLIVVTADHGEEHWEHGRFEHGHALWSEVTRVPLAIRAPGIPAGRSSAVVELVDVFRTLLAIAGVAPPAESHGADLRVTPTGTGFALSENCLHGPSLISATDGHARVVVDPAAGWRATWTTDGATEHDTSAAEATDLFEALRQRRGGFFPLVRPAAAAQGAPIAELRALGYLDGN